LDRLQARLFPPVRVLSRLFRRLFLGDLAPLAEKCALDAALAPLHCSDWFVYAKRPFAGPQAVLAYLARYTHRVAISNSRLIRLADKGVTFKWKDYRFQGRDRFKTMTLDAAEFIRRFLLHVLPSGFHRIRHYGLFAGAVRARNIERVRQALAASEGAPQRSRAEAGGEAEDVAPARSCPCCGGRMIIVETFEGPPCAIAIPKSDQDRHLMTVAPHPISQSRSLSLPAARRTRTAMSSHTPAEPLRASTRAQAAHLHDRRSSPSSFPIDAIFAPPLKDRPRRSVRDPQIPIARAL
jgi:hypothetical protein